MTKKIMLYKAIMVLCLLVLSVVFTFSVEGVPETPAGVSLRGINLSRRATGRLGILAGSFDPIHPGHLQLAEKALKELNLDRLLFVPNAKNPRKQGLSPLSFRADLVRKALLDWGNPNLQLFPEEKIEKADAEGPPETAFRRIFLAAAREGRWAKIFLICGSDALPRVLQSWMDFKELDLVFVMLDRPGTEISRQLNLKEQKAAGRLIILPESGLSISSTEIRNYAHNADLQNLKKNLLPSVYQQIILDGSYGLASSPVWLEALLEEYLFPPESDVPKDQAYLRKIVWTGITKNPAVNYKTRGLLPEIEGIDLEDSHTLGDWKKYVQQRITRLGLKILANHSVGLEVVEGSRKRVLTYMQSLGMAFAVETLRKRGSVTTSLFLGKDSKGNFRAILPGGYGKTRLYHNELMAAGAMRISGRATSEVRVLEYDSPAQTRNEIFSIFREALSDIKPESVQVAVVGFQGGILTSLAERLDVWKTHPVLWSLRDYRLADRWTKRKKVKFPGWKPAAWPAIMNSNADLNHCILSFVNDTGKKSNLVLTRNVYGDQLEVLLEILAREKGIPKILVFGNSGGIKKGLSLGDLGIPRAISQPGSLRTSPSGRKRPTSPSMGNGYSEKSLPNPWRIRIPGWITKMPFPATVHSVFSPLQETEGFIETLRKSGVHLVDVEISHIMPAYERLKSGMISPEILSLLQVSDLPGTHQSLTELPDNKEQLRKSMVQALDLILVEIKLCGPPN